MANNTISTDELDAVQVTAIIADIKVAKQRRLESRKATAVTVLPNARGLLRFEPSIALVHRQVLSDNRIMKAMTNILFQIILNAIPTGCSKRNRRFEKLIASDLLHRSTISIDHFLDNGNKLYLV